VQKLWLCGSLHWLTCWHTRTFWLQITISGHIWSTAISSSTLPFPQGGVGNEDPCPICRWWVQHSRIMSTSMHYRPNKLCLTLSHALGIRNHCPYHFHLLQIWTNLSNKLGFKKGNQILMIQFQPSCATRELGIVLSMALPLASSNYVVPWNLHFGFPVLLEQPHNLA